MPFRERVRRALKRGSISNDSNSSDDRSSGNNPNVYQPGEKMPPMKYRRPVAKEHKEKLESFNFATAWRRMSHQSLYSPMGSRFPSRKNSLASRRASMASRKSIDRNQVARRSFQAAAKAQPVAEAASDEGDVGNVGLSQGTRDDSRRKRSRSPTSRHPRPRSRDRAADMSASGRPFAPEDLSLALKRTHLAVPAS